MTLHKAENWSVSLLAGELKKVTEDAKDLGAIFIHPEIIERDFKKCCIFMHDFYHTTGETAYGIGCKKGLWMVEGTDKEYVTNQAKHYFIQYWSDGEYDDILGATEAWNVKN